MRTRSREVVLVVLVACVAAAFAVAVVARHAATDRAAAQQASVFNRTVPNPVSTPDDRPVVTLIGDDLSSAAQLGSPTEEWPYIASPVLGDRIISLSSPGAGYTAHESSTSFGGTFAARASQADPDSKAVVVFGGANDVQASAADLRHAVERTLAAAHTAAPHAAVVVVGPAWPSAYPPPSITSIRDTVRSVAEAADVKWVDPIDQGWLTGHGLVRDDDATLTTAGEQAIAHRMESLLRSTT